MLNLRSLKWAFPICGLALALGFSLTAMAQDAAPTPQPEATPPAHSAPAPQTQQAPDAQPQDHAQAPAQSQGPSVDDELRLTPDQKEKIAAVVDDENKQIGAIRDDTSLSLDGAGFGQLCCGPRWVGRDMWVGLLFVRRRRSGRFWRPGRHEKSQIAIR